MNERRAGDVCRTAFLGRRQNEFDGLKRPSYEGAAMFSCVACWWSNPQVKALTKLRPEYSPPDPGSYRAWPPRQRPATLLRQTVPRMACAARRS
jgi:hypothetical protein